MNRLSVLGATTTLVLLLGCGGGAGTQRTAGAAGQGGGPGGQAGGVGGTGGAISNGGTGGAAGSGGTLDAGMTGDASARDGGKDSAVRDSGSDARTTCDVSQPFGTPVLVDGVNQSGTFDADPRLTSDELTMFLANDSSGNSDIYLATRTTSTSPFGTPQALAGVNSSSSEGFPSVTSDLLTIFLESNRAGLFGVFMASRSNTFAQFSTPSLVASIYSGQNEGQSQVLPDGSALYFVSFRSGGVGGGDIYRAPLQAGQVGAPGIVSTINSTVDDYVPTPSADELVLYFASNRADSLAKGGYDIWMAKRASRTANFDPPVNVQELNTAGDEEPSWISPDKCRLYLHRGGTTGTRIYVASRSP